MREKEAIRKQIIENIEEKRRDWHGNLDALEFLVTTKVTESAFFELREPIRLRNFWRKKTGSYLLMTVFCSFFIYGTIRYSDFGDWWPWLILTIMIVAAVSIFAQFLENEIIIEISSSGLTFDNYVFNKWDDIEFLYFRTEEHGTYLVEKLKNGYEHELMISHLPWSADKLGRMLYQCMKRYGK